MLLVVAAGLLVAALLLPWWTETELYGGATWTQTFSPVWGISGTCAPTCGAFDTGPPLGPLQGTHSFASLGLAQTEILYLAALAVVVLALGLVLAALIFGRPVRIPETGAPGFWRARLLALGALVMGVGAALLPLLQPIALRDDVVAKFSADNAWTPSPSPETSFWGSCTRQAYDGVCSSGATASWGPDWGWIALVVALGVLLYALWRRRRLASGPSPAAPRDPTTDPGSQ